MEARATTPPPPVDEPDKGEPKIEQAPETPTEAPAEPPKPAESPEKEITYEKLAIEATEAEPAADSPTIEPEVNGTATEPAAGPEKPQEAAAEEQKPEEVVCTADAAEVIEVSELKEPEPEGEALEYTVLEEEVETNETIEEHIAQETVLIINEGEDSQIGFVFEKDDEEEEEPEYVDEPAAVVAVKPEKKIVTRQRGRKPIGDVPLHILGRNIAKPNAATNGGRTMPKPRLGVKVPYRNLTSQIVSKQEIENEIMERYRNKQEQNAATAANTSFARRLTQRLAKKIIPELDKDKAGPSQEIRDDSDLLAILEGNDDEKKAAKLPPPPPAVVETPMRKETEKEIALRQLEELPMVGNDAQPVRVGRKTPIVVKVEPKAERREPEPKLNKTGSNVKTYARKRKSSDTDVAAYISKKSVSGAASGQASNQSTPKCDEGTTSTSTYITKSSRVIKRKVIWDPDEAPAKSPTKPPSRKIEPKSDDDVDEEEVDEEKTDEENDVSTPEKEKKSQVTKTSPQTGKKRLTEVDRLLMDEGAVNMLYDMKNADDAKKKKLNQQTIEKRTNVIKNDLQSQSGNKEAKSLRKKDVQTVGASPVTPKKGVASKIKLPTPVSSRKRSKDSNRSSVHSPPASPMGNAADASRIIRRHSSSSFSSNNEEAVVEERMTRARKGALPVVEKKKVKKTVVAAVGGGGGESRATNNNSTSFGNYETFAATKAERLVSIRLFDETDSKCYLSGKLLKELTKCLLDLGEDDDCNVVSIVSRNKNVFCGGLNYGAMVVGDLGARKKKANEISTTVKEFLKCLLYFPKILVAGIQGDCSGLGVTMLPLFDMIISSDTSTYSTPYASLGAAAEAGFLLTLPHVSNHGLASELLFTSHKLKADDVFRRGLITRLCWPEKYNDELSSILADIASRSNQSLEYTKMQLRQHIIDTTEKSLNSLGKALVEHWISDECQANFAKLAN